MRAFLLLAILSAAVCVSVSASATTFYVDGSVSSSGDGKSWETAVKTIQEGIDLAYPGDTVIVAPWVFPYTPSGALVFEGKAIVVESKEGPEATRIDWGAGSMSGGFIFDARARATSVLRGFTITNALSGIACYPGASPTITNCIVSHCQDGVSCHEGGPTMVGCTVLRNKHGITCEGSATPSLTDCAVTENDFEGMHCIDRSDATVVNCSFSENGGHGIVCDGSSPVITNSILSANEHGVLCENNSNPEIVRCVLSGNRSSGVYCDNSSPVLSNCLILDNAAELGGGVLCRVTNGIITNCTIRCRSLEQGAEIFLGGVGSDPTITNTVLWGDSPRPINWHPSAYPTITYCAVRNGWLGEGNTDADPQFRNFEFGDLRLRASSSCVDAGSNEAAGVAETDLQGIHRIMFGGKSLTADIGAYEFHIWPPTMNSQAGEVALKWSSLAARTYTIYHSSDMLYWDVLAHEVPSAGDTVTTFVDSLGPVLPPGVRIRYYKVMEHP